MNRAVAGQLGEAEEQTLIGALGELSVDVANRYDAWVRTGTGEARANAVGLADQLLPLLERLNKHHQGRLDKAQNDIIEQDGNPEVLYDQAWWQLDRGFALATMGQLTWLYYRSAMLHPEQAEASKDKLRKAVKGFEDFIFTNDQRLRDESLLGRALAERELGEFDAAIGDLQPVLEGGPSAPLYWPARITLAEVKAAQGGDGGLSESGKLVNEMRAANLPADVQNQARFIRFQALAAAMKKGGGPAIRQEAAALSRELTQLGPVWSRRVNETALASTRDPRQLLGSTGSAAWIAAENLASEEKFAEAAVAYQAVLKSTDAAAREHHTLAHHRLGVCFFRLNRWQDAEREFRAFLNQAPKSPLAGEAAYLRFRAAEGIYRARPDNETKALFVNAVETFVRGYPKHESFFEGAFRLGEMLQAEGRFLEAADLYGKVNGPPAFEIRASAGAVAALADTLLNPPEGAKPEEFAVLRDRALEAYARFEKASAGAAKSAGLTDLKARTTISKAMVEGIGPKPQLAESLQTLRGFEEKYPAVKDVHPLAAALRLSAETSLKQVAEAESSLAKLLASPSPAAMELLDKVARRFLRNAADEAGKDQAASDRWTQMAAMTFDRFQAAGRPIPPEVRTNLAQFYMQKGRLAEAATLYSELVKDSPQSKSLLRNAAMVADQRGSYAEAADYWARLAKLQETASPAWYDARFETAENLNAAGQAEKSCKSLQEVENFRPDLRDAATKKRFADLAAKACRGA